LSEGAIAARHLNPQKRYYEFYRVL